MNALSTRPFEPTFASALALVLILSALFLPAPGAGLAWTDPPEIAPGVRIERSRTDPAQQAARERLREWQSVYSEELRGLFATSHRLFEELEKSSLATLVDVCQELGAATLRVGRERIFPTPEIWLDRLVFGALERYAAASAECSQAQYVKAYRLLTEGRAGFERIDRKLELAQREPIRLPGLGDPSPTASSEPGG